MSIKTENIKTENIDVDTGLSNKRSLEENASDVKKVKGEDAELSAERLADIEFRRARGKLHKYAILLSYNGKGYYGIQR